MFSYQDSPLAASTGKIKMEEPQFDSYPSTSDDQLGSEFESNRWKNHEIIALAKALKNDRVLDFKGSNAQKLKVMKSILIEKNVDRSTNSIRNKVVWLTQGYKSAKASLKLLGSGASADEIAEIHKDFPYFEEMSKSTIDYVDPDLTVTSGLESTEPVEKPKKTKIQRAISWNVCLRAKIAFLKKRR